MKKLIQILFLFLLAIAQAHSQYGSYGGSDARNIGMGNSYTACAIKSEAIGRNPAMLHFGNILSEYLTVSIPSISGNIFTNTLTLEDVNFYFGNTSRYLTENEKNELLEHFRENDGQFYYHGAITPLAVVWKPDSTLGTFALAITDVVSGNYYFPSDFAELLLEGNKPGRTYSFDELNYNTWWLRSYSISYSNFLTEDLLGIFKNIHFGVTGKYINGFVFSGMDDISSSFHTGDNNVLSGHFSARVRHSFSRNLAVKYDFDTTTPIYDFNIIAQPSGHGFGFDFGLAAEVLGGIDVGMAITDLGYINWSDNIAEHQAIGDFYIDDLFDKNQLDTLVDLINLTEKQAAAFQTVLPIAIRLGAAWEISKALPIIPGEMTVVFDYNQGLTYSPGNSSIPRISLGSQWRPMDILPIFLIGFTNDRSGHTRISMGLGYYNEIFSAYLSTQDVMTPITTMVKPYYSIAFSATWNVF